MIALGFSVANEVTSGPLQGFIIVVNVLSGGFWYGAYSVLCVVLLYKKVFVIL